MHIEQKSRIAENLCRFSYLALLLMMILTSLPSVIPEGAAMGPILLVKLLPLLIVLPGLLLNKLRSYIWLCFIVLFYFTQAVVETFLSMGAHIDFAITIATTVLFIAAMLYVKWERSRGREL